MATQFRTSGSPIAKSQRAKRPQSEQAKDSIKLSKANKAQLIIAYRSNPEAYGKLLGDAAKRIHTIMAVFSDFPKGHYMKFSDASLGGEREIRKRDIKALQTALEKELTSTLPKVIAKKPPSTRTKPTITNLQGVYEVLYINGALTQMISILIEPEITALLRGVTGTTGRIGSQTQQLNYTRATDGQVFNGIASKNTVVGLLFTGLSLRRLIGTGGMIGKEVPDETSGRVLDAFNDVFYNTPQDKGPYRPLFGVNGVYEKLLNTPQDGYNSTADILTALNDKPKQPKKPKIGRRRTTAVPTPKFFSETGFSFKSLQTIISYNSASLKVKTTNDGANFLITGPNLIGFDAVGRITPAVIAGVKEDNYITSLYHNVVVGVKSKVENGKVVKAVPGYDYVEAFALGKRENQREKSESKRKVDKEADKEAKLRGEQTKAQKKRAEKQAEVTGLGDRTRVLSQTYVPPAPRT